ncbi:putative short-chain dehydrogenase/oxidoreductase [Pseudomassariella vexata]|uniref:Putative short-chain dehydrogenase/oxidoreductase n=1 Tax=Pseudomassariella vexata TaxID=1141098 RepID=A0A1Y2DNH2_9PEZI|nr:putative short-chain dehydrogenase/oxidoreductase [Pseudomassariella vexata]ORY60811.1 putative short-chain dehydrogenase/oxidoreductase [Pseudomassariella vexata]
MAPLYQKALIIGATSGIGEALAAKLLSTGTSVIITGRRQDRLDAFVSQRSNSSTSDSVTLSAVPLDITDLNSLPTFASSIAKEHPTLDCIILNSGIQRGFDFARPSTVDLATFDEELTTNYISFVHLVTAFLPQLQKTAKEEGKETHLVFIGASLGLVPSLVRTPGYNASKAALHSWIMNLRQQLKDNGDSIRVVEVFPPAVQTELHDEKHQPHLKNGGEIGMPLADFIDQTYTELEKGDEQFAIGPAAEWLQSGFEAERQKMFQQQQGAIKTALAKYMK